jgi:hypothetical protein
VGYTGVATFNGLPGDPEVEFDADLLADLLRPFLQTGIAGQDGRENQLSFLQPVEWS